MNIDGFRAHSCSPYSVTHDLNMSSDLLNAIAARHRGVVEKHAAHLPVVLTSGRRTSLTEPTSVTVTELEDNGAWVTMFAVQDDPDLQATTAWLYRVMEASGVVGIGLTLSLVCSSAKGVTPAHMDAHDVLLLQLRGDKVLGTGSFTHRRDTQAELRRRFGPKRENLSRLPDVQQTWSLAPGHGVFIPAYTPHWAEVGAHVSVALSVGITSPELRRQAAVHAADAAFVRRGVRLPAPGRSKVLDAARVLALAAVQRAR